VEENYSYFLLHCITGAGKLNYSPEHFKYLWERETDPEWRRDLVMVGRDWFPRIVQRNLRLLGETVVSRSDEWKYFPSTSETISASVDYISAIFINHEVNGDMALWGGAGNEAYDWDRRTETELREAVQSHPNNPRMHLDLGVFLAHSSYQPEHPNEGLHECLKAVDLRPKWYRPRMEIAHILLRYKNYKGALEYLEQAVRELPYVPNKLAYTFGFAKMMNKDYIGSLDIFEKIIQKFPDHALALDNASYCCFQLGETVKGKSRAKRAQMYGISTTYDQYDVGGFKEKASLPLQTLCERVGCRQENCKGRNEVEEARDNLGKIINKS
jgi:tetratricopeptide (TPR) repeat protein